MLESVGLGGEAMKWTPSPRSTILCDETGADASRVGPETLLLAPNIKRWMGRLFRSS